MEMKLNNVVEREFICLKEAAKILGISDRTMKRIIEKNNEIHSTKLKGKILINKNKLLDYINNTDTVKS